MHIFLKMKLVNIIAKKEARNISSEIINSVKTYISLSFIKKDID